MNKIAKANFGELFALGVVLLAVVLLAPTATQWGNNLFATGGGADGAPPIQEVKVVTEKACGSTTMAVNFDVLNTAGVALTLQNASVFTDGEKQVISEGSTFTAQGGQKLRVYPVFEPTGTSYLGGHYEGIIPCTGQTARFSTSDSFMVRASGSSLLNDPGFVYEADSAAAAATIINDDFTANPGTAQSITAGQTKVITVRLFPVFKEGYGLAGGNTLACRFTDSQIDQSATTVSLNGINLGDAIYVPSSTRFAVSATNQSTKYWSFDPVDGKITNTLEFKFGIKGDDNSEPTAATNFSCNSFGTDYYEHNDGTVKIDVEDRDDNSKIGRTAANEFSINILLS